MATEKFVCPECAKVMKHRQALNDHRRDAHHKGPGESAAKRHNRWEDALRRRFEHRIAQPHREGSKDWAIDLADGMDLPDGAYWAFLQEHGVEAADVIEHAQRNGARP